MSHEAGCTSCGKWWSLEDCWFSPPHSNTGTPPNYNITSGNGERFYIKPQGSGTSCSELSDNVIIWT